MYPRVGGGAAGRVLRRDRPGGRIHHTPRSHRGDTVFGTHRGQFALLAWLPCRMICPTCGHRTRIATASWTRCELAWLTADLPVAPAAKEVLVVEQHGGKYVQEGRWQVPARIELRTRECRVVLDFTQAVATSDAVRIETDMVHGKLLVVSAPGTVIDTDGLALTYSKLKLGPRDSAADPR